MNYCIRKATREDVVAIARLIRILSDEFVIYEFSEKGKKLYTLANNVQIIDHYMARNFSYSVAELNEKIIGVISMRDNEHIYQLFVDKEYQGKGIGTKLWLYAKSECLKNGNKEIFTVHASNNAVCFYEKLGFVRYDEMQDEEGILYNPMKFLVSNKVDFNNMK